MRRVVGERAVVSFFGQIQVLAADIYIYIYMEIYIGGS